MIKHEIPILVMHAKTVPEPNTEKLLIENLSHEAKAPSDILFKKSFDSRNFCISYTTLSWFK